jgi:hypothetical protein
MEMRFSGCINNKASFILPLLNSALQTNVKLIF